MRVEKAERWPRVVRRLTIPCLVLCGGLCVVCASILLWGQLVTVNTLPRSLNNTAAATRLRRDETRTEGENN